MFEIFSGILVSAGDTGLSIGIEIERLDPPVFRCYCALSLSLSLYLEVRIRLEDYLSETVQ